jgi:hypothetical protein
MINKNEITALIITSAIKSIPEIRKNMHSISRVAKDSNFIEETLENIKKFSGINKFLIVHDFKIDSEISKMHSKNLFKLKNKYKFDLLISPSSLAMPSQLTASNAFKLGISQVESKYLLFWEHDHLFIKEVDWDLVSKSFEYGGKLTKFNRQKNNLNSKKELQKELILKKGLINQVFESNHKDLLSTNYYCNGPFIAEKDFCEKLWNNINFEIPNWNGIFGGFIEGPVNQKMIEDQLNQNEGDFRKKYPLFVYGGQSFDPIVIHRGNYYPKYKFSIFSFDTYRNIPRILKHKLFNIFKNTNLKK